MCIRDRSYRSITIERSVTETDCIAMGAALLLELVAFLVKKFNLSQGFFYLVYTFFSISYSSLKKNKTTFADVPMGIPSYVLAFVVGSIYIKCWMTGACACFVGLGIKLYYIWVQETPTMENIVFSLIYAASYILLILYFYINEYGIRFKFYLLHKREEFQSNYHELIASMPVGLILFDLNNVPFFCNHAVEEITAKEGDGLLTEGKEESLAERVGRLLSLFKDKCNHVDLKTAVEQWDASIGSPREYTYLEENMYVVRGLKGTFKQLDCKILILEDQTSLYNLSKVEKKYQKLYLTSVVHDIRTPLNGIFGMLEMVNMEKFEAESKAYIDTAKRLCKLMLFVTCDIIDFTQLEANKLKLSCSKVDIHDVIEETYQLIEFSLKKKQIKCKLTIDENIPEKVYIDRMRYVQILLNLVTNSLKYTFEGSVEVQLSYDEATDLIVTRVKDTGIGIKAEDLPKLFRMYTRLDKDVGNTSTGIGFGLSIAKRLVEFMQGSITVESKEGVGSTFMFTIKANKDQVDLLNQNMNQSEDRENADLSIREDVSSARTGHRYWVCRRKNSLDGVFEVSPRFSSKTVTKATNRPITSSCKETTLQNHANNKNNIKNATALRSYPDLYEESKCSCVKILIVDDNEYNLYVLQNYLKSVGSVADEALNGQQAISKVLEKSKSSCCSAYKLILMDINMPLMDGITAATILKEKAEAKEIPRNLVIALSAKSIANEDHNLFCHRVGFTDYLNKPIGKKKFVDLVKKYEVI
eukprot:TRINITY_DN7875_c0_g1_i1.p1 TRINITY_DN7875_c0_g1~~TRINITY_DN7875_c0_g1_i1.p1  ORF type:complete len:755 (+),score=212.76 TRINITY_DN7875_c0_g1_i1:77-2341(+)